MNTVSIQAVSVAGRGSSAAPPSALPNPEQFQWLGMLDTIEAGIMSSSLLSASDTFDASVHISCLRELLNDVRPRVK